MSDERKPLDLLRAVRDLPRRAPLQPIDKVVLMVLILRSNVDGQSWPSYLRIAADTWASARTIKSSIKRLVAAGLVASTQRRRDNSHEHDSNLYTVTLPREVVQHDHHVVKPLHKGSATVAPHVVIRLHGGGDQVAQEVAQVTAQEELPIKGSALRANNRDGFGPKSPAAKPRHAAKNASDEADKTPGYTELLAHYWARYELAKGAKPDFHPGRTAKAVKDFLAAMSLDDAKAAITKGLDDPWTADKRPEIWELFADRNKHRGSSRGRREPLQAAPQGGSLWDKHDKTEVKP